MSEDSNVFTGYEIGSATMTVSPGPQQAKPRGRPKASQAGQPTQKPVKTDAVPTMIRVVPKHGYNLYCHTQQKILHAGFETQVLPDWWINNQIERGILTVVK